MKIFAAYLQKSKQTLLPLFTAAYIINSINQSIDQPISHLFAQK